MLEAQGWGILIPGPIQKGCMWRCVPSPSDAGTSFDILLSNLHQHQDEEPPLPPTAMFHMSSGCLMVGDDMVP